MTESHDDELVLQAAPLPRPNPMKTAAGNVVLPKQFKVPLARPAGVFRLVALGVLLVSAFVPARSIAAHEEAPPAATAPERLDLAGLTCLVVRPPAAAPPKLGINQAGQALPDVRRPVLLAMPPGNQGEQMAAAVLNRYWAAEAVARGWIVVAPIAPEGETFTSGPGAARAQKLLDAIAMELLPQGGRVHVAGVSNGGIAAFALATARPEMLHSLTTLPGGDRAPLASRFAQLRSIPVHLFVGASDAVWVSVAEKTQAGLKSAGVTSTLTVLPDQGHVLDISPAKLFDQLVADHALAMTNAVDANPDAVLIELYTSEGCSSCPPADDVLAELAGTAAAQRGSLVLLAFHVEYWDHLGWPDRFALSTYSNRQRTLASKLEGGKVYTPQMFVGGVTSFVGSDRQRADKEVQLLTEASAARPLSFRVGRDEARKLLVVDVLAPGAGAGQRIHAALLEDNLTSEVKRGENAGKTLRHQKVVRAFQSAPGTPHATVRLAVPAGADQANLSIAVCLQEAASPKVLSAATLTLASEIKPPAR